MRNRIWYDLIETYKRVIYLTYFIKRQKSCAKIFKILTLIFSVSGLLGSKYWDIAPIIALVIISIFQVLTLIIKEIVPSEKDIETLIEIKDKYFNLFTKQENLFNRYHNENITEDEAIEEVNIFNSELADILKTENKVSIKIIEKLLKDAEEETHKYRIKFNN